MGYFIDFVGVDEETKDSSAIAMKFIRDDNSEIIGIYDGGLKAYGTELHKLLDEYYFTNRKEKIAFIICSHSDQDHVTGLIEILEECNVDVLYMNRPWLYVDELFDSINDGRITKNSLEKTLRESFKYIDDLEKIALKKDIEIKEIFQGQIINDIIYVLSPSKEFYLNKIIESSKTPMETNSNVQETVFARIGKKIKKLIESWTKECLREDVETSPENETSVICLGISDEEHFLLTGDAGIQSLSAANSYANKCSFSIKDQVNIYQIPHHGGRHNLSPSLLNKLIGNILPEGSETDKTAFVSTGKNSDHPLQMVVNAFIRRGVKVYNASGKTICHHKNVLFDRNWTSACKQTFNQNVEDWED